MKKQKSLPKRFEKPKGWKTGTYKNQRGHSIRKGELATHFNPAANIIFVSGLSEFQEKYYELAKSFNDQACNIYTYDPPGQGYSDRLIPGSIKQHSQGTQHDVDDLIQFAEEHVPQSDAPTIVFGHSTGGLVSFLAAEQRPDLFDGMTLTAPLFSVNTFPVTGNEHIFAGLPFPEKLRKMFAPGQTSWRPRSDEHGSLVLDDFTADPIRQQVQDYWTDIDPELKTDGVTWGWLIERCKGIVEARKDENIEKADMPFVIATAEDDKLVSNKATYDIIAKLDDVTHLNFEDAGHELYLEKDEVRDPIIEETMKMIKRINGKKGFSPS